MRSTWSFAVTSACTPSASTWYAAVISRGRIAATAVQREIGDHGMTAGARQSRPRAACPASRRRR